MDADFLQMREIVATARALGHNLPDEIMDTMIHCDPMDLYLKPSMQCDFEKACIPSPHHHPPLYLSSTVKKDNECLLMWNREITWSTNISLVSH